MCDMRRPLCQAPQAIREEKGECRLSPEYNAVT